MSGQPPRPKKASAPTGRLQTRPRMPSVGNESAADQARDRSAGIKEGSAQDDKLDAMPQNQRSAQAQATDKVLNGTMHGNAPNPTHMAAMNHAAGIAHAILGGRRMV